MAQRETQNLSLQPVERRALRLLAERESRGNVSDFAARLIQKAARETYGLDWQIIVSQPIEQEDKTA